MHYSPWEFPEDYMLLLEIISFSSWVKLLKKTQYLIVCGYFLKMWSHYSKQHRIMSLSTAATTATATATRNSHYFIPAILTKANNSSHNFYVSMKLGAHRHHCLVELDKRHFVLQSRRTQNSHFRSAFCSLFQMARGQCASKSQLILGPCFVTVVAAWQTEHPGV